MRTRQRNIAFVFRNPLQEKLKWRFRTFCTNGPFQNFNPTSSLFQDARASALYFLDKLIPSKSAGGQARQVSYQWTSRNNRKGLHVIVVFPSRQAFASSLNDSQLSKSGRAWAGICRMFQKYPVWDISYLMAILFTLGSLCWLVDGILALLPAAYPGSHKRDQLLFAGGILAFVGTTILFVANILQMLEIINENRTVCFGWTIQEHYDKDKGRTTKIRKGYCSHHHRNVRNLFGVPSAPPDPAHDDCRDDYEQDLALNKVATQTAGQSLPKGVSWSLLPSYKDLREYHLWNIGFYACAIQFASALVFYMAAVARLPPIYDRLSHALALGLVWIPKIVGATGFTAAAWLFMVETQTTWWLAAPSVLGWHIGALGVLGGLGFVLSLGLTIYGGAWAEYQAAVCTIVASLAYFASAVMAWYESLEKYSVLVAPGDMLEGKDPAGEDCDEDEAEKPEKLEKLEV